MGSDPNKENRTIENSSHFRTENAAEIEESIKQLEKKIQEKEDLEKDLIKANDPIEKIIRKAREGIIIDDGVEKWISLSKEKIKISMSYLHNLINDSQSGIFICDREGWITNFNKNITGMLGFNRKELSQINWLSLFMGTKAFEKYKSGKLSWDLNSMWALDKRRLSSMEDSITDKSGKMIPILQYSALLMDNEERPFGIIFLNKDLLEIKRLKDDINKLNAYLESHLPGYKAVQVSRDLKKIFEKDLKETKDHLESIFENSLDAILTTNNSGHITKINRAFKILTGYQEKELIKEHLAKIFPVYGEFTTLTGERLLFGDENFSKVIETIGLVFAEGKLSSWEHHLLLQNGKVIPFEANVAVLKDKDGNSIGTVISFRDLTERKKAELELQKAYGELQKAKEFLENIISTSVDGIITTDPKGSITRVNESVKKITGYTNEELRGMHITQLSSHDNEQGYQQLWNNIVNRLSNYERVAGVESIWKSKDDELIPIELNAAFLKDEDGRVTGGVIGVRDIRERRKIQEIEMKNDFISNVSHELRTPLTSIKGSIVNLLDGIPGKLNDAQKEYLAIINSESNRLVRLIDELLDLNNVEARQIKLVPKEIDYISLVAQVVFSLKELAHEKGLFIEMQWPKTEIYLKADSDRVNQILVNLINNAIKFTKQGGIQVIVENPNNKSITTRVKDTGIGIPKNELDKVFDKFYQAYKPHGEKSKGTGLGLSISKSLIEMHGGTIFVKSEEGQGSEFCFTLPTGIAK
jgi:PAS domain S-box-containing protein